MDNKFFGELSRRLKREGITTLPVEQDRMPVLLDGQEVMAVAPGGTVFLMPETADSQPVMDAYDIVAGVTAQVCEYTRAMAAAPRLKASGLHENFRLLAEYNGTVLAGRKLDWSQGYQFATWRCSPDRTAVAHGHYYDGGDAYEAAKLDFACRAGLVDEHRQFTDEQLTELYRCVHETLDSGYPITKEREDILTAAAKQIESSMDDLGKRVEQSNQRELEAAEQHEGAPAKASSSFRGERRGKEAQCGIPEGCSTWSGLCPDDAGPEMGLSP